MPHHRDLELDPAKTYSADEVLQIAIRAGQHAGHRAALDADALRSDKDQPLFLTEERVQQLIREAVDAVSAKNEAATVRLLKRLGLNTDDDEFDDTAAKLRAALNFPSSAWGFTKWVGGTLGSALLISTVGILFAMFGWKKTP